MLKTDRISSDVLVFFLIALSGSILHVGFFTPTYVCALLYVISFLAYKKIYAKKYIFLFIVSLVFFSLIFFVNYLFSNSKDIKDYVIIIMQVLLALLIALALQHTHADFKYHLYRVLQVIIMHSFIGFILSFFDIGTQVELGGGYVAYSIFYLFYYFADLSLGFLTIYRNQGIFWEPGLLAIYANIFLLLSLFVHKNRNNSILAILCVLTTASTTGIFLLLVQIFFFIKNRRFSFLQKMALPLLFIPILVAVVVSFKGKMAESEESNVSSYGIRIFDLYSGVMVTASNPIFGVGLNKSAFISERDKFLSPEIEQIYKVLEERGSSNSLLMLFYSLGIVTAFFWLYMLYKQDVFKDQRRLFFIILVIAFISEPLVFTPFFMYLTFLGFQKTINIKYG